ncbi:MAG: acyl-CoA dehydrogenase family protein [Burkholderiaceae bacterium]
MSTSSSLSVWIAHAQAQLDAATRALALRCASGARIDGAKADAWQVPSYELAWAAAHLLAARTLDGWLASADAAAPSGQAGDAGDAGNTGNGGAMAQGLARLFIVEALVDVIARLEAMQMDLGLDGAALRAWAADAGWLRLRQQCAGQDAQKALGAAVAAGDADFGAPPLSQDVRMAFESFARFADEQVAPLAERIHREDLTIPESLLQPLREMGVFGLSVPQRFGGIGPDDHDDTPLMVAVTEALSEGSLGAAGSLITRPEILSRALLAGGTDEQKTHWLPRLAAGDPLCAIAMTEPDHGSDVASLQLRATRTDAGWVLDGAKTWCTFAGKAGVLMVVARTEADRALGHKGLSLLLVEKPSTEDHAFEVTQPGGGRLSGRAIPTIGYRGMHSYDLSFQNFLVPHSHLVGGDAGRGKGFYLTMQGMMGGRMQTAARACGVMRAALRAACRYARDRKVFGEPLAQFALTQSKLSRMAARWMACRHAAYAVAQLMDAGGGRMEASLVKLLACRSAEIVTREALQLHGGMGYAEETAVSRYFVDARVLSIFEGAEETLALKVVARSLLEGALAGASTA